MASKESLENLKEKLLNRMQIDANNGCWLIKPTSNGYVRWRFENRNWPVHRLMFELFYHKIPEKLVLDHICRSRNCVNPTHLRMCLSEENVMVGEGVTARNAAKTHCVNGHKLDEKNLYFHRSGNSMCRQCKKCTSRRFKEYKERQAKLKAAL